MQYEDNMLRQFCNPNFDRDKIVKSSAYKRELSLVPFGGTNGSDKTLLSKKAKSLTYRLNSSGIKMQP